MMSELKHCQPKSWNVPAKGRASLVAPSAAPALSRARVAPLTVTVLGIPDERIRPLGVND